MTISSSKHVFLLIVVISFVTSCSVLKKPVLKSSPPTKLHIASSKGLLHEVKQYLIEGGNVNKEDVKGNTPLHEAVFNSHIAVVEELVANGAYINARNKNGRTPLHTAIEDSNYGLVEMLLKEKADPNTKDKYGNSLLFDAAKYGHRDICKLLIKYGANINIKNNSGKTPLFAAIAKGNTGLVNLLLRENSDPNIKDKYENTPLYNAALYGHQEISKLLIDSGVNIEAKNYNGRTPLYAAVEKGNTKLVSLFLREKADPNAKDKYGNTPLQEAVLLGNKDISAKLFKHGAVFPNESYDNVLKNSSAEWLSLAYSRRVMSIGRTDTKKYKYTEYYPVFSWPPPLASTRIVIPRQFLEQSKKEKQYIYDIDKLLSNALSLAGYSEKSYYSVPNGFALATRLEQINADGTPKNKSLRWQIELPSLETFSLRSYISALFTAPIGFYRVIVFVVVPHPFTEARVPIVRSQALKWLSQGSNKLPNWIKEREYSEDYSCTALIYEFEKPKFIKDANITMPSRLQAKIHLVKSGFWKGLINE